MNSRDIAYHLRRKHKQPQPKPRIIGETWDGMGMKLSDFFLKLDVLTNQPEAHPDIEVRIMTLDGEFHVGSMEIQTTEDGGKALYIQSLEDAGPEY